MFITQFSNRKSHICPLHEICINKINYTGVFPHYFVINMQFRGNNSDMGWSYQGLHKKTSTQPQPVIHAAYTNITKSPSSDKGNSSFHLRFEGGSPIFFAMANIWWPFSIWTALWHNSYYHLPLLHHTRTSLDQLLRSLTLWCKQSIQPDRISWIMISSAREVCNTSNLNLSNQVM